MQENATITLRTSNEVKDEFSNLVNSLPIGNRSEIFGQMLTAYKEKQQAAHADSEMNILETAEPQPKEPETEETQDEVITIKLKPVQRFALVETILKPGFIDETNDLIQKVDAGIENSFFNSLLGNDLYSGQYAGIFDRMEAKTENPESMNKNIAATLVNLFMAAILNNSEMLESPVTKELLKQFIAEENAKF